MKVTVVSVLVLCSVVMQESRAQFPGTVGQVCRGGNLCLDTINQVCDTHLSPPLCKIKPIKSCRGQPQDCVSGATCQNDKCVCDIETLDNGQCRQQPVVTESPEATTMTTAEQTTEDAATTARTTAPVTSTTTPSSGAVDHSNRCVGALIFPVVMMLLQHTVFSLPSH